METQQLMKEIDSLPEAAKREIEQFLFQLKLRYARLTPLTEAELAPWKDPELFGMYADRADMQDSTAYIRKLRNEQWGSK